MNSTLMLTAYHAPVFAPLVPGSQLAALPAAYLVLPYRSQLIFLAFGDIVRLEGAGNYTYIHTRDNRCYLASKTLKRLEQTLPGPAFCRVHKSSLVNLAYLTAIHLGEGPSVWLRNSLPISIARRRLAATRRQVKQYRQLTIPGSVEA